MTRDTPNLYDLHLKEASRSQGKESSHSEDFMPT